MNTDDDNPGLVSAVELGRYLSVHRGTLLRWARQGRIPCKRLSATIVRFDLHEVEEWLTARGFPPPR